NLRSEIWVFAEDLVLFIVIDETTYHNLNALFEILLNPISPLHDLTLVVDGANIKFMTMCARCKKFVSEDSRQMLEWHPQIMNARVTITIFTNRRM
ncbi:19184_t:CDS:2, partial [Funneliformis geosporum]